MKLVSWNVNGIRAVLKKGFWDFVETYQPDILGVQETKIQEDQLLDELLEVEGYHVFWHSAKRKGYSGVATFSKPEPLRVQYGLGIDRFDEEGRVLITEYPEFLLFNIYFPNGQRDQGRLDYKLDFYAELLEYLDKLQSRGKRLVICGDYNTAHREIDLKNPKQNEKTSGFLPVEREWIDRYIEHGYVDTFRLFHPDEPEQFTWWTYRFGARSRNIGWRIDYFFVSQNMVDFVKNAAILPDVMGSDHCPIVLELEFKS